MAVVHKHSRNWEQWLLGLRSGRSASVLCPSQCRGKGLKAGWTRSSRAATPPPLPWSGHPCLKVIEIKTARFKSAQQVPLLWGVTQNEGEKQNSSCSGQVAAVWTFKHLGCSKRQLESTLKVTSNSCFSSLSSPPLSFTFISLFRECLPAVRWGV